MNFIDDVLSGRVTLPMVPKVVLQLLSELRRDDVKLSLVASLIEKDPVLSSRILRMANTSYFGGRRSIESVQDAVSVIGSRPLTTLLIACGAQSAFANVSAVNLKRFWDLSQLTAVASRQLAGRLNLDKEAAYSAGLLSPVGHLILCQCEAEKARRTFNEVRTPWGAELANKEQAAFGVSHPQISAIWVDQLGMPSHVARAIDMCQAGPTTPTPPLSRAIQIGSALAAAAADAGPDGFPLAIPEAILAAAGLPEYIRSGQAADDLASLMAMRAVA